MGATVFNKELDYSYPGAHSNTFGGNPVSCAAALATFDVYEHEHLLENARRQGEYLKKRLEELQTRYEVMGDVRGLGLMVATEFVRDRRTKEPAAKLRDRVETEAYRRGLILLGCGTSALRFIPPLVVQEAHLDEAVEILEASLKAALASQAA